MAKNRDEGGEPTRPERFASIDALRGTLLLLLLGNGFGLRHPDIVSQQRWHWLSNQFTHREWIGCSLWDLLCPAFLFVVGLSMPFSWANRQAQGQGWTRQFLHALLRTAILLALGIYLDSYRENHLVLDIRGTLQMLALAYLLSWFLVPLPLPVHAVAVLLLLMGHTLAWVFYSVFAEQEIWSQAQHVGLALDRWLTLGPHREHLVALNLVPATATVLAGVLFGGLVRGDLSAGHKVVIMTLTSLGCILLGWLLSGGNGWIDLSWFALEPMIPRLGTATYVLTTVGWSLLLFTYFFTVMEGFYLKSWALPLAILGQNSLLLYLASQLFRPWAVRTAGLFLPESQPTIASLRPLLTELIVVVIFGLFSLWLYRRRIFFKV
jgi:predicted acyltransferase